MTIDLFIHSHTQEEYSKQHNTERRKPIIHKAQGVMLTDPKNSFPVTQYAEHFGARHDNFQASDSFAPVRKFEPPVIPMALATSYRNTFTGRTRCCVCDVIHKHVCSRAIESICASALPNLTMASSS